MRRHTDLWSKYTWKRKATLLSYRRGKTCLKGHLFRQEETVAKRSEKMQARKEQDLCTYLRNACQQTVVFFSQRRGE